MSHSHSHGHSHAHEHQHPPEERRALQNRLRKLMGQLRAIEKMIDDDVDCTEVLVQVVSARKALKSFAEVIIAQHTQSCIAGAATPGQSQKRLAELVTVLKRYVE